MPPFTQEKWPLRSLSAVEVREIARASRLTGRHSADVTALAQLRASGEQPGNAHRDLVRKFFKDLTVPEPFILHTKVWRKNAGGEIVKQEAEIPLFLPHLWIPTLEDHALVATLGTEKVASF